MKTEMTEKLVRFQRPEKSLPYLNGADEAHIAALFGLSATEYRELGDDFTARARDAAARLLDNPDIAAQVDRLPFAAGAHVVALGESTTADRLSWFEILRHLLELRRPADRIRLTNLAVSGSTTTQALKSVAALGFLRPDWVLCALGGNDAQQVGIGGPLLVSANETARNLTLLRSEAARLCGPRWVWLTPATMDEELIAAYPHFQQAQISWTTKDLEHTAQLLRARPEPVIDAFAATTAAAQVPMHIEDGVHLTLEGQRAVAIAAVATLAELA
ncbi:SGNH/GDSL hydrolase family protein [Nocardia sp. NPDC052566]|uniref:SGNH/GDSL hydrolase family protein n=1 Tax=Nocardia sp. NPDC052566 TaxID=3364330 RepID=UPI0037C50A70